MSDQVQLNQIEIGGIRIAYRRAGKGPPLILLHGGLGSDSREWRNQLEDLSDEFTVVAWDMPGCGQSADPPENFRTGDYVDCLAGLIGELDLVGPHVAGLSLGSLLALELYRRYPEIPKSLILASAYAGWVGSLPPEVAARRKQKIMEMTEHPPDSWAREWVPTLLSERVRDDVVVEVSAILAEFHPEGQRTLMHSGFAEIDLRDVLSRITVPTLLLYGDADVRSPKKVAEDMHARIPGSRLSFIPGIGHLCDIEAPDLFNAEVRGFIRSVP